MIGGDIILFALLFVTAVNLARCLSALRSLLYIMRNVHPLLYQQVDGRGFFSPQGNLSKQVRLYYYIKSKEYTHHHDELFTAKCDRVRQLFILCVALIVVTTVAAFIL
ncbi:MULTISPECIES: universal stress protein UspB [Vibrio]|uniref:Universal stress protein B n=2 Tax=Vibrio TaxID=662 RepID=A0A7X4RTP3_9VIBR|nr:MULTISPECIES: universal stress protein UspB [Vibrio]MBF9002013.1 universal stress protein UspB [Vibrio nitrifigilis]MZI92455.1 universal stress protein UspB [Vibrio eleionomae]